MGKNRKFKNLIILFISPILALGIFLLTQNLDGLTANVLDIAEKNKIREKKRDIAYKTENKMLEIFTSEFAKTIDEIIIEILYNEKKINFLLNQIPQKNIKSINQKSGILTINLSIPKTITSGERIFYLPFSGEKKQLIIGEAWIPKGNGKLSLKVGSLNKSQKHNLLP